MLTPLEQASGILGEHMINYVIVVSSPDAPNHAQIAYDSKYAASGLVKHAQNVLSKEIEFDSEYEIVWDDEEQEEE
jgi:hypothetical protein|tara:strand:+ start:93 stop:320 length:228 start_codon:yes stop_codon:yes gene_type:complete